MSRHQEVDYPDEEHLRNYAMQQLIYAKLFNPDAVKHPLPQRYQLRILKALTARIEQSVQDWAEEDISDDLMNHLSSIFSTPIPPESTAVQQMSYVTYTISSLPATSSGDIPTITLLESPNLLTSSGITGFRTWEAGLFFGDYLCQNSSLVQGKSVLELGSGTAYVSILCAKYLGASHVLSTDGSEDVVANLPINFYLNALQDTSFIEAKELKWGHALIGGEHSQWKAGRPIDLVLGADITYDPSWFPSLLSTFCELFGLYPAIKFLVAATVRNPETFQRFLKLCDKNKFKVKIEKFEVEKQEGPFYSTAASFKICVITRSDCH